MPVRVVFACGLAELLTCGMAVDLFTGSGGVTNILVLYGRPISMPPALVNETKALATAFGCFNRVFDLVKETPAIAEARSLEPAFLKAPDFEPTICDADEILLHTLWAEPERLFVDSCPKADIILFDNGVASHQPHDIVAPAAVRRGVRENHLERVAQAFYSVGDLVDPPKFIGGRRIAIPAAKDMRRHVEAVSVRLPDVLRERLALCAGPVGGIVLGTAFYRNKGISFAEERRVYRDYIAARGAETCFLFKDHPRGCSPLIEPLANVETVASCLPIEFYASKLTAQRNASISSTGLLTLKKMFGVGYDLIGCGLSRRLGLPWMETLNMYAEKCYE